MDLSLRLVLDWDNMVNSRVDANLHIKANRMKLRRGYSQDYTPGHYNLTASMRMTHLDDPRLVRFQLKINIPV